MAFLFADPTVKAKWWPGPASSPISDMPDDPIKVCNLTRTERNRCIALNGKCGDRIERHFRCLEQFYPKERVMTLRREFRSPAFMVAPEEYAQPFLWWRNWEVPHLYFRETLGKNVNLAPGSLVPSVSTP
eukprot:TRINITY_DN74153_c0_g1_i1.p1 TRINITY_DN74153_c0_g1~~TRINITY_DN74153_c0_g1_i1.p1  ORF type:complete len:130 (-),score=5.01 TRINITY_DN74153_c0_g1_i1:257-646(-)